MEFGLLIVMSTLVKKLVDTAKYATNGDVNGVVTQIVAWGAGVLVTAIGAHSDFAGTFAIADHTLASLNGWSQALVGVNLASLSGVGWDLLKAIDNTNSAVLPNLLGSLGAPQGMPTQGAPVVADSPTTGRA